MNHGCHGATVEMTATPASSQVVVTAFVVSCVEATSITSIPSSAISSLATSAARFGFEWLSLTMTSKVSQAAAGKPSMTNWSASAKPASGPDCGLT
jgi:hypothetical protein